MDKTLWSRVPIFITFDEKLLLPHFLIPLKLKDWIIIINEYKINEN